MQQIYSLSPLATRESIHKADRGTRTLNLLITNQLLCQLSHIGTLIIKEQNSAYLPYHKSVLNATTRMGLEPTTSAVTGRRSNQLSHRAEW